MLDPGHLALKFEVVSLARKFGLAASNRALSNVERFDDLSYRRSSHNQTIERSKERIACVIHFGFLFRLS
jgi:hypothetical protein